MIAFGYVTLAFNAVAFTLVCRRGLIQRCWTFALYLGALVVCGTLAGGGYLGVFPPAFVRWAYYAFSRDLYSVLKMLIAVELGAHVFRAFPRARAIEEKLTLLLLLALLWLVLTISPHGTEPWLEWRRRLNVGTLWLFASWALLAAWFHLPLDRWRRALLVGFTGQLVVQTLFSWRLELYAMAAVVDPVVAAWWAYSAWRPVLVGKPVLASARAIA